jgi:hypothetical protein
MPPSASAAPRMAFRNLWATNASRAASKTK